MIDRYVATTSAGTPIVRTDSRAEAERCAGILGGTVIDQEAT